ncbi:response regulator transcription factor [Williamwhitmania taraxaci]|uniref:Regulatory protein, luxR family n=1 Tax=Williamwhitmania taraxaci TaxID=1640674 RepID=A0A1G6TFZ3_9BACT|nr:response regulator transcription factor [Williamwhitmania taraxaci]SDD27959.1 regulatory protein, luxR family [Williamwhitmania taraxaci]
MIKLAIIRALQEETIGDERQDQLSSPTQEQIISFIHLTLPLEQELELLRIICEHQEIENGMVAATSVYPKTAATTELSASYQNKGKVLRGLTLMNRFIQSLPTPANEQHNCFKLTCREVEIMELITRGLLNKEIAAKLNISPQTVKNHLRKIFQKLRVENRTEATALWLAMLPR